MRAEATTHDHPTSRDVVTAHRPGLDLGDCFWLVPGNIVPCIKDTSKRQPTVLLDHATDVAIVDSNLLIAGLSVLLCACPVGSQGKLLYAEPRASVVSIAIDERNLDATVKQVLDVLETSATKDVASDAREECL